MRSVLPAQPKNRVTVITHNASRVELIKFSLGPLRDLLYPNNPIEIAYTTNLTNLRRDSVREENKLSIQDSHLVILDADLERNAKEVQDVLREIATTSLPPSLITLSTSNTQRELQEGEKSITNLSSIKHLSLPYQSKDLILAVEEGLKSYSERQNKSKESETSGHKEIL